MCISPFRCVESTGQAECREVFLWYKSRRSCAPAKYGACVKSRPAGRSVGRGALAVMAAGVTSRLWEIGDIVEVLEACEATNE